MDGKRGVLGGGGNAAVARLAGEFGMAPPDVRARYVRDFAPIGDVSLERIGNSLDLYGLTRLGCRQDGYSDNPITRESIEDWRASWFLIGDEGADPMIVDLTEGSGPVYSAMHGAGRWDFRPISDNLAAFLVCSAAVHHALTQWDHEKSLEATDLCAEARTWLRGVLQRWAGRHFDRWFEPFETP